MSHRTNPQSRDGRVITKEENNYAALIKNKRLTQGVEKGTI
jgi:hypothetical protein